MQKSKERLEIRKSCDANFTHVDSASALARIFNLHVDINACNACIFLSPFIVSWKNLLQKQTRQGQYFIAYYIRFAPWGDYQSDNKQTKKYGSK